MVWSFRMNGGDNALPQLQYGGLERLGGRGVLGWRWVLLFQGNKIWDGEAVNVKVTILSEVTPCRLVDRRAGWFDSVLVRCWTFWQCDCSFVTQWRHIDRWVVSLHLFSREVRRSAASPLPDTSFPWNMPPIPMTQVDSRGGMDKLRIEEWLRLSGKQLLSSGHFTELSKILLSQGGRERERSERERYWEQCCL
jgi:hypothetical protein